MLSWLPGWCHLAGLQLRGEDFDGALLLPWLDAHTAAVAALTVNAGAPWGPTLSCMHALVLHAMRHKPILPSLPLPAAMCQCGLPLPASLAPTCPPLAGDAHTRTPSYPAFCVPQTAERC